MAPVLPVASLVIAAPAALVLAAATACGVAPLAAAGLAVAALAATTGALHEDGLADAADGFFGGFSRERRLEIMRDSRIGAFGACAVCLSLLVRAAALAAVAQASLTLAVAALGAAAAVSRTLALLPLWLLPPARTDGSGASVRAPGAPAMAASAAVCVIVLGAPVLAGASLPRVAAAAVAAALAAGSTIPLAREKIGGQTGDVAGAAQQLAEIAFLAVLSGAAS